MPFKFPETSGYFGINFYVFLIILRETFLYHILMALCMIDESVSVIIPAYNEEANVKRLVRDTIKIISSHARKYEIIVVDDGSTDNTLKELSSIKNKNLKVIKNKKNMGKTKTMVNSFSMAKGDIVSFIDADYQYDPKDLVKLIEKVREGNDICIGNRRRRRDSLYRKFMSWGFNTFDKMMFGIEVKDVNCGLKAFKKESFKKIKLKFLTTRWFIDTELLARYYRNKSRVAEIEISHYERKNSVSKVSAVYLASETLVYGIFLKLDMIFSSK